MKYLIASIRAALGKGRSERGVVFAMCAFLLAILMAVGALVFDLGYSWVQKRQMQIAADAGALAAVWRVQQMQDTLVFQEANVLAAANEAQLSEVSSVECGTVNPNKIFTPCGASNPLCANCQNGEANAIRMRTLRRTPSIFAKLLGISELNTPAESVAMAVFPNSKTCVRPFGIEASGQPGSPLDGVSEGETFTMYGEKGAPGNWGKLDIGGIGKDDNMSSGRNFEEAMLQAVCDEAAQVGQSVSQGTGFGGPIDQIFDELLAKGLNKNLYMPKVTNFKNGNSNVQILGFILTDYIGTLSSCGKGRTWCAVFKLVADNVSPPLGGGTGVPNAAHLIR
ncbi:MAG: hypothetical protein J5J00_13910 [Deltaproteobacteria bacterium]|nr:hypothetical protein [Deltaproteobacteria bacterium]